MLYKSTCALPLASSFEQNVCMRLSLLTTYIIDYVDYSSSSSDVSGNFERPTTKSMWNALARFLS